MKTGTGTSPYRLTYSHEEVLPFEIVGQLFRVARQNEFDLVDYHTAMMVGLEGFDWDQLEVLNCIQVEKRRVARNYNTRVKTRHFKQGDLVWKVILSLGKKDQWLRKW